MIAFLAATIAMVAALTAMVAAIRMRRTVRRLLAENELLRAEGARMVRWMQEAREDALQARLRRR